MRFDDFFRVKDDGPELSTLSMGACLDLLPVLGKLLDSKYEEYEVTCYIFGLANSELRQRPDEIYPRGS